MPDNPRHFLAGPDPFGRNWKVTFRWLQNAITIRHSDSVDVKFELEADDGTQMEKVIALMHPDLIEVSRKLGRQITDPWCIRLAGSKLRRIIETWEDAEKTIVTPSLEELEQDARGLEAALATAP